MGSTKLVIEIHGLDELNKRLAQLDKVAHVLTGEAKKKQQEKVKIPGGRVRRSFADYRIEILRYLWQNDHKATIAELAESLKIAEKTVLKVLERMARDSEVKIVGDESTKLLKAGKKAAKEDDLDSVDSDDDDEEDEEDEEDEDEEDDDEEDEEDEEADDEEDDEDDDDEDDDDEDDDDEDDDDEEDDDEEDDDEEDDDEEDDDEEDDDEDEDLIKLRAARILLSTATKKHGKPAIAKVLKKFGVTHKTFDDFDVTKYAKLEKALKKVK